MFIKFGLIFARNRLRHASSMNERVPSLSSRTIIHLKCLRQFHAKVLFVCPVINLSSTNSPAGSFLFARTHEDYIVAQLGDHAAVLIVLETRIRS